MLTYETYTGSAPNRRKKKLPCQCEGRCEPTWAKRDPSGAAHGDRCAITLQGYGRRQGESREKRNGPAICSPCVRRMVEVGVDVPSLHIPNHYEEDKFPLPALRVTRKNRKISVEKLSSYSGVPETIIRQAESSEEQVVGNADASALAAVLRVKVDKLRGITGRGGKAPGIRLRNLRAIRRAKEDPEITAGELAKKVGLSVDAIHKIEDGRRGAYPDKLERICRVLGCTVDDLQREDMTQTREEGEAA